MDTGQPCLKQPSIAKPFASEAAEKICSTAIHTLGGDGYTKDLPVQPIYRDVRVTWIYEGASGVQRMVISRAMAGA